MTMFSEGDTISFQAYGILYLGTVVSDKVAIEDGKYHEKGRVWAKWSHLGGRMAFMDESNVKLVEKALVEYTPTQVGDTDDDI